MTLQEKLHPETQNSVDDYITIIKEVFPNMKKPTKEFKQEFKHYCYLIHLHNQMLKTK